MAEVAAVAEAVETEEASPLPEVDSSHAVTGGATAGTGRGLA